MRGKASIWRSIDRLMYFIVIRVCKKKGNEQGTADANLKDTMTYQGYILLLRIKKLKFSKY